jgi:dUTP pyrophosphatase
MLKKYDRYTLVNECVIIEATKDNFSLPRRETQLTVGYDLFSTKDEVIRPLDRKLISTGIKLKMPEGIQGEIRSRRDLANKYGVFVLDAPSTISPDFKDEIKILLANIGHLPFDIVRGDKIAQLIFSKHETPNLEQHDERI